MGTIEEFEAFADYVNDRLCNAEFGIDWERNAFTYRADGGTVFVRLPISGFGRIDSGVMYVSSALGVCLILSSLKKADFDGRVTNDSLAVHFA